MLSMARGCPLPHSALLVLAVLGAGCGGENLVGPDEGTLEVSNSTTGIELDADGYIIQIDGGTALPLGPNTTLRRGEVAAGPHTVLLGGVSANCAVEGDNPRSVSITAGQTVTLTFSVTCGATTGSLRITSTTSGSSPDADGYTVTIDGSSRGTLAPTGQTTIHGLTPGDTHTVGISGVSGNCQVEGDNPRSLTITAGSTAEAAFAIACQALPPNTGTIQITTATSGPGTDADGYAFSVDGGGTQPIGANATALVISLGAGAHSVQLSGTAAHCTLTGDNPRSVVVPGDGTVAVTFSLSCQATTGSIQVTTSTSGPNPDPDGYAFAVDGESARPIGLNATSTVDGVMAGVHEVRLSGIAGNCVIQGTNPRAVPVTAGNAAAVAFAIACSAATIAITANPPVSALSGEVFDPVVQPVLQVKDGSGNPVGGAQVTARIVSGGGRLEGTPTATTNASGVAKFGDLGIRGTGEHTLEFTAGTATVTSSPVTLSPLPTEATRGKWGPVVPWDIVPLHMSLLPNGKIFAWGKTDVADTMGMPRVWDPAQGAPSTASMINVNEMLFCAGHTLLADGSLMIAGGHRMDGAGIKVTYLYQNGSMVKKADMANGRWYPTLTVLPDGNVLAMAGRNEAGTVVPTPELWNGSGWAQLTGAGQLKIPYYPRNFVDPRRAGQIFYAGEQTMSRWFNYGGSGSWTATGPQHIWPFNRDYGTAVMYDTGKILYAGGGGDSNWPSEGSARSPNPTNTAEKIDLDQASPTWQSAGVMSAPRRHLNSTILPDGQVLITGGTRGGGFVDFSEANAVKAAEVWNPTTGQWTTLASNSKVRVYHSVSLLLPDGTVLHGASGDAMAGALEVPKEKNHEIFSPPYLFKGARPTITSVTPASVGYAGTIAVATPNAAQITGARWIRLGSVTHAFDMSQRANTLSFTRTATGVEITAPASPNLAPPGYYMLFILNRNGVPSAGKIIQVQ